jgi:hypothetical protein
LWVGIITDTRMWDWLMHFEHNEYRAPVSCPINSMAFVRQLPDQLAVFQGGASRTGTYDEHICIDT